MPNNTNAPYPDVIGRVRLIPFLAEPGCWASLIVTTGPTCLRDGRLNVYEAMKMVSAGEAKWMGGEPDLSRFQKGEPVVEPAPQPRTWTPEEAEEWRQRRLREL
jgi:hypothetical protein